MTRLLITIPTWNEAVVIERNLCAVLKALESMRVPREVMIEVADNASTDATRDIVRRMVQEHAQLCLISVSSKGKGLAIRSSWERHVGDADVLMFMDADLAADIRALPRLIQPILEHRADIVCGSRFLSGSVIQRSCMRTLASWIYRAFQRSVLRLPVKDAQCGFKAISSHAASRTLPVCRESGWMFDSELLAIGSRLGMRVQEIPVDWIERRDPARRSALCLFRHGWGFIRGLFRIRKKVDSLEA